MKNADDEAGASVRESEEESVKEEETSRGAAISDRTNVKLECVEKVSEMKCVQEK